MCADGRSVDITNLDPKLVDAMNAFYQTGSLGPMIKEELKLKIQTSRLAAGKKELPKPVFKEPEKSPLTEEEEKRNKVRRERNRIAALKCRNKQKLVKMEKLTEVLKLEKQQRELKTMVHDMELEKEEWIRKLLERNIRVPNYIMATIQQQPWPPFQSEPSHPSSRECPTPVSPFLTSPSPGLDLQQPSATSPFRTPSPLFFQPPPPQNMPQTSPSPSFLAYLSQTCTEDIEKAFLHGPKVDDVENVFRHDPKQDDIENVFLHGPKQPEMEQATCPDAHNVFPAVQIPHAICPSPPPNDSVKLLHFGDLRENLYTQQEPDVDIDILEFDFLDETSLYTA